MAYTEYVRIYIYAQNSGLDDDENFEIANNRDEVWWLLSTQAHFSFS